MADIIKPHVNIIDESFDKGSTLNYKLVVQACAESFNFCIQDADRNKYIVLQSYLLSGTSNPEKICKGIEQIISQVDFLKSTYKSVVFTWVNQKTSFVPAPLFEEKEKNTYLDFSHSLSNDEEIAYDKLQNLEAYNLYAIPTVILKTIKGFFPGCNTQHSSSALVESLLVRYKNRDDRQVFVNVMSSMFEIVVLEGKKLILYNNFRYESCEDFIYYILFVTEQLKLNPETASITLLGEIEKGSALYEILYKYVRNIGFIDKNDSFDYSYKFKDIPSHFYYNLLNVNLCV